MTPIGLQSVGGSRLPIYFGAPSRPLFGFFHPPVAPKRDVGVVLCSPLGTDQSRSTRTYRQLAEALAAAGFACLRFDPFGTGDSAGDEESPDLVRAWIDDVGSAADELRALSGVKGISLVGLRFGGTIALSHAAQRGALESLVLWDPCVSGAAFLAEITKLHKVYLRMQPQLAAAPPAPAEGQEALGGFFPRALVDDLSRLDLLTIDRRPARRTLLIDGGHFSQRDALRGRLEALDGSPEVRSHLGHKFLTMVSQSAPVPREIIESIVSWLSEAHPARSASPSTAERPRAASPANERPLTFGREGSLFGILTPADSAQARPGRPPIIITNAGCVNRAGPHRLSVRLARRWAQLGFDVLRLDLSGLGDSPPAQGVEENLTYPPSALADIEEAIAALGSRPAIVVGLCSGGDYAFQMGANSRNVVGSWLLNPRTFGVLDLAAVESGDGLAPATTDAPEVPLTLRRIAGRGVDTVLLVSRNDPGVAFVDTRAPEEMRGLSAVAGFRRFDIEGADHTFTPVMTQRRVSDLLTEHLLARF